MGVTALEAMGMAGTGPGIAPTGSVSMDTEAAGGMVDTGTAGAGTAMDTDTGVDVATDAGTIATAAIISRLTEAHLSAGPGRRRRSAGGRDS